MPNSWWRKFSRCSASLISQYAGRSFDNAEILAQDGKFRRTLPALLLSSFGDQIGKRPSLQHSMLNHCVAWFSSHTRDRKPEPLRNGGPHVLSCPLICGPWIILTFMDNAPIKCIHECLGVCVRTLVLLCHSCRTLILKAVENGNH